MSKIIIAGDFCPAGRVSTLILDSRYNEIMGDIRPFICSFDYSVVNLECPIVIESEKAKKIHKTGPHLKTVEKGAELIRWTGFKGVTLANNHFYDYGQVGVSNTLEVLSNIGLDYVGGGKDSNSAEKNLYVNVKDKKVAFLNCCEHEFSIATENTGGSNPLNPVKLFYKVAEARKNADFVILIVHGGHEHYQLPSPRMKELYRYFIDIGCDCVVNHHQHCYSGYEYYEGKPIVYGLGNFCFDKFGNSKNNNSFWNEGYMVGIFLNDEIRIELYPYIQCRETPDVKFLNDKEYIHFLEKIELLNGIINDDISLKKSFDEWISSRSVIYKQIFSPYSNKYLRAACAKNMIPSFLSDEKLSSMYDHINCESHRDILLQWLKCNL